MILIEYYYDVIRSSLSIFLKEWIVLERRDLVGHRVSYSPSYLLRLILAILVQIRVRQRSGTHINFSDMRITVLIFRGHASVWKLTYKLRFRTRKIR